MDTYTWLRQFADSWMLLFLFLFFIGVVVWVVTRRSSRYRDAKMSIFRNEDRPAPEPGHEPASGPGRQPEGGSRREEKAEEKTE